MKRICCYCKRVYGNALKRPPGTMPGLPSNLEMFSGREYAKNKESNRSGKSGSVFESPRHMEQDRDSWKQLAEELQAKLDKKEQI